LKFECNDLFNDNKIHGTVTILHIIYNKYNFNKGINGINIVYNIIKKSLIKGINMVYTILIGDIVGDEVGLRGCYSRSTKLWQKQILRAAFTMDFQMNLFDLFHTDLRRSDRAGFFTISDDFGGTVPTTPYTGE